MNPDSLKAQSNSSIRPDDSYVANSVTFSSSNLPIIVINTHGGVILDNPKIEADMKIIYNGEGKRNTVTDTAYDYNGKIGIEIRGSSSQMFPKKQYGVETRNSVGENLDVSLLGFPADNDWILYAAYNDKTLMRDVLAYTLSRNAGKYATRTCYCELILNGEYMGIYILFEKVKQGKMRVNISKLDSTDTTGDALTGGYIIRMDKLDPGDNPSVVGWYSQVLPFPSIPTTKILYQYTYPKSENIRPEQKTYIQNFIKSFETTMNGAKYADSVNGYPKYLDISSAIDYMLVNELAKNVDAYRLSAYMFKDKDSKGGKLNIGPSWDFTNSLGNCDYYNAWLTEEWWMSYAKTNTGDYFAVPAWWKRLFYDSTFMSNAKNRWIELRSSQFTKLKIFGIVDSLAAHIDEAQKRNFVKWPILGSYVWPNKYYFKTYPEEITFLKSWINDRLNWMDTELAGTPLGVIDINSQQPSKFELYQNYPNPFNPATVIQYQIPVSGYINLKVYDALGREVATLVDGYKDTGRYEAQFSGSHLASGLYIARLTVIDEHGKYTNAKSMKMQLVK